MRISFPATVLALALPLAARAQTTADPETAPSADPSAAATPEPAPPAPAVPAPAEPAVVAAPVATVTPPAAPEAPTPAPVTFAWEALVDAYYLYNFTGDPKNQAPALRQFDSHANNLTLSYAKLGLQAATSLVALRLDVGGGHSAAIINGGSTTFSASGPSADALYGNAFLVQQAFATVKALPYLTIDAGKFVTSAGAEVIEANKNWLYSRSLLFFGIPLLHTGLRVNIIPTTGLTVSLQVVNGWNNDPDANNHKTFGGNVTFAPPDLGLTASVTTYIGKEGGPDGDETRMVFDGVFVKELGALSLGLNLDYFKLGDANWFGGAVMGRYLLTDAFNVAARAEYVKSKNGAYLDDVSLYEVTGLFGWTVDKHFELRVEVRADLSDEEVFMKGSAPRKNQVTGLLAALAYF